MGKKKPGRPKKPVRQKNKPISASIPADVLAALAAYEKANDVTRSQAVTVLIKLGLRWGSRPVD